jgi:beta-N-acetylhexosaminidase
MKRRLIIDITGTSLSQEDYPYITHSAVAGVLLFTENFTSKQQLAELCTSLRTANPNLLLFVDQEGGQIQRFSDDFTPLPSLYSLGQLYAKDPHHACQEALNAGYTMATELKEVGLDCSFAPVLDLHDSQNPIIGQKERAFDTDPDIVIQMTQAMIRGMHAGGMPAIGKHFPGHGSVIADSHHTSVIDARPYRELKEDLKPFIALKDQLAAIMTAHIIYPTVDDQHIVCHSEHWHWYLREKLNYKGLIISDCLSMQAAQQAQPEWTRCLSQALTYCDLVILTHQDVQQRQALLAYLDEVPELNPEQHNAMASLKDVAPRTMPQPNYVEEPAL